MSSLSSSDDRPAESSPPPARPPAESGWLSGLVSGAGRLISSVFGSDSAPSSPSSSSSYSTDEDTRNEYEDTAVSPKEQYELDQSGKESKLAKDYLEGSLAIVSEIDSKHAIEELLMQETFSRDECNKLTRIIQSRVVDFQYAEVGQNGVQKELLDGGTGNAIGWQSSNHAGQLPGTISYSSHSLGAFSPGSFAHQVPRAGLHNTAVMESKKWSDPNRLSPSSKSVFSCGHCTLNTNMPRSDFEGEIASPVDLAKSYMQSVISCESPSLCSIGCKTLLPSERNPYKDETAYATLYHSLPSKARKRNCRTFTSGDFLDQTRRVRHKPMENVLHISKFKQIDLSGGYLEYEAYKAPSRSVKGSLDTLGTNQFSNYVPSTSTEDHSALGAFKLPDGGAVEVVRPPETSKAATTTITSYTEAAVRPPETSKAATTTITSYTETAANAVQSTHESPILTALPLKLTHFRVGGFPYMRDPAVLVLKENQDVGDPSKAKGKVGSFSIPCAPNILLTGAVQKNGDSSQGILNSKPTIMPKEDIKYAPSLSAGFKMEQYVKSEENPSSSNFNEAELPSGIFEETHQIPAENTTNAPSRRSSSTRGRPRNVKARQSAEQTQAEPEPSTSHNQRRKAVARPRRGRKKMSSSSDS